MGEVVRHKQLPDLMLDVYRRLDLLERRAGVRKKPLNAPTLTTAERDALDAVNADLIYNSTTNKFQGYANGSWVDLHL